MATPSDSLLLSEITDQVIKAFYHVYNSLGYGFLERVYEQSLMRTLQKCGLIVEQQQPIDVWFEGEKVGRYFADLIVAHTVIIEVKSESALCSRHEAQLL